jgi:hypothetical protein
VGQVGDIRIQPGMIYNVAILLIPEVVYGFRSNW